MKFTDLFSRADEEILQIIVGRPAIKLISRLDVSRSNPSKLKESILQIRSESDLLRTPTVRNMLIDLMAEPEVNTLANLLKITNQTDNYRSVKQLNIRKGSRQEQILFEFLEVPVPAPEGSRASPSKSDVSGMYQLFDHQRIAVSEILQSLATEPKRALLHMPTGSGKTRTAMHVIARHLLDKSPSVVIWLAYSDELCTQASEEFMRAWESLGDRSVQVYRYWGSYKLQEDEVLDGIVVAGLGKTFASMKSDLSLISKLGAISSLIIIDEAHQAIAESYKLVLDVLTTLRKDSKLLGLTATPGRTWDDISEDESLANFFGKKKVSLTIPGYDSPVDYLVEQGYLAHAAFLPLLSQSGLNLSAADLDYINTRLKIPKPILKKLEMDEQRNIAILLKIEELVSRHKRIIVFALSVSHSNMLAYVLNSRGINASSVTYETAKESRKSIIDNYKQDGKDVRILCNYGVFTTGFDAPRTSAAMIARPTTSLVLYSQMVGRAIRGKKAGGNKEAEIITVVDTELPGFGSVAEGFYNWEDVWRK